MRSKFAVIAAAIAMAAGQAQAANVLGELSTNAGTIKITDAACPGHEHRMELARAISTQPDGRFVWGCWAMVGTDVMMIFENGDKRMHPATAFRDMRKATAKPD